MTPSNPEYREDFWTRHPWAIAPAVIIGVLALIFIEPVVIHYADAWWSRWLQ